MRRAMLLAALLLAACQTSPNTPLRPEAVGDRPVTFNNQVVRIFQRNCQICHRPGEVAPFSLTTYKDAHAKRDDIVEAVESRYMPPWKAVPGHGEFTDVRRLSDDEIRLIARWVADGAPEGDARDLPSPRRFPTGWTLGTPSAVLGDSARVGDRAQLRESIVFPGTEVAAESILIGAIAAHGDILASLRRRHAQTAS